jgi:hypothetical protein
MNSTDNFLPSQLASLCFWISEREAIRKKHAVGAARPWTTDPILATYKFCNVERERDRATIWITNNWMMPNADHADIWFAAAVARLVNRPDTLQEIGFPIPWNAEHFVRVLQAREARGESVWADAYRTAIVPNIPRPIRAANILEQLWQARETLRPRVGDSCGVVHRRLEACDGLGEFLAAQIIADVKYVEPLKHARDWQTFAAAGPGSRRGLNRLLGRPIESRCLALRWRADLRRLHEAIKPELERLGLGDLHAQNLQNICCETDKYLRGQSGNVKGLRRYTPAAGSGPCPPPRRRGARGAR